MKIRQLVKGLDALIKGNKELEITGISANSKLVCPGSLFIARKGRVADGTRYIGEAVAAGAVAVATEIYDPSLRAVTQIIYPHIGRLEGILADRYYGHPSKELWMVGITGTNGKTTSSFLTKSLVDALVGLTGLIGTIEYVIGAQRYEATRTTPDVVSNHKMLREMVHQGGKCAVMEVTSHALDQGRVDYIDFDTAVFTNLSLDHLDYHGSMELYAEAKRKLFLGLKPEATAIVNGDDPWAARMVEGCQARLWTFGLHPHYTLSASDIVLASGGTHFSLHYQGVKHACFIPLVGRYNVYNALAAISVCLAHGIACERVVAALRQLPAVPGRLEAVANNRGLKVYVDFAHSDDALQNVLECLRELGQKRIITVFGCGGERDRTKRPKMAEAAERFSDYCLVTTDNPRSEDPLQICQEIAKGFSSQARYQIEVDRAQAIRAALDQATPEDIVLIAGKGHETYQRFAHKTVEFDDRKVAAQILHERQS